MSYSSADKTHDAQESQQAKEQAGLSQIAGHSESAAMQLRLPGIMANSARVSQLKALQATMAKSSRVQTQLKTQAAMSAGASARIKPAQINSTPAQLVEEDESLERVVDEPAQLHADTPADAALPEGESPDQPKPNNTGLPDNLKSGIESLSGMSMDQVKVHYNSSKPAQLQAHAFAQGNEIHVAPGQERHLPHEAWHVVQQAQGRVRPTLQMKGTLINDDVALERDADEKGDQALHAVDAQPSALSPMQLQDAPLQAVAVAQRQLNPEQLDQIAKMPRNLRIEYLSRMSDEDWDQVLNEEIFNYYGATEDLDEIREQRELRKRQGEDISPSWLAPIPDGNARAAAEMLAVLDPPEETPYEEISAKRQAFLTLIRNKVKIAYLEDLKQRKDKKLLKGDPEPVAEFLHPEGDGFWLPLPAEGTSLYYLHYIIARKSDAVLQWRDYLLSGVAKSGEDGDAPQTSDDDPDIDDLISGLTGLSIADKLDSRIVPMDIDTVKSKNKSVISKTQYDADGDVIMDEFEGTSDIEMSDVHGSMNISYHNVTGSISMDIDHVDADMDIEIRNVSGDVHIVLMDIDLSGEEGREKMDIDIADVAGAMELVISEYDDPMDLDFGSIDDGGFRRYTFNKRKREDTDTNDEDLPKSKRRRLQEASGPAATSVDDLIGLFETLAISFRTGLDEENHNVYPARNLSDLIVASDPTPLSTIIADGEWLGISLAKNEVKQLKVFKKDVEAALAAVKKSASKPNNNELRKSMVKVADFLSKKGTTPIPITDLTSSVNHGAAGGPASTIVGQKVIGNPISPKSTKPGTVASDGALIGSLRTKLTKLGSQSSYIVGAHLLNMKVWGPGELWNLTPASKQFNSDQESKVEEPMKRAIYENGIVMYYEAEATYNNSPVGVDHPTAPEKYLFTKIKFTAKQWHEDTTKKKWEPDASVTTHADVKKINCTMPWDHGNLPAFMPIPNAHTDTTKKLFSDQGFPASVVEALTSYNSKVAVGATIPGTKTVRKKWSGNVGVDTFISDLQFWLDSAGYKGTQKRVNKNSLPANWKKVLDFS